MYVYFLRKGLCVIPLKGGRPLVEWSKYFTELPDMATVQAWRGEEYALVCGGVSSVIGLDVDTDDAIGARVYAVAGETPVRKRGSKGFTAFYKYNGEASKSWKRNGDKSPVVELLSDKRLTTIPPSVHRKTGEPYVWLDGVALGDVELPALPEDFFSIMDAMFPQRERLVFTAHAREDVDLSDIAEALEFISSDCSREEWVSIGMGLRDEFGDSANELWHQWSAKAAGRYNARDAQAVWRSFHGSGVTIGTVLHKAREAGYLRNLPTYDISLDYGVVKKSVLREVQKPEGIETLHVHGLVGDIARWITETAVFPQPVLSLAAALVFVGMLKGHRVRGYTDLRTNLLILSLGRSASGKEHPQSAIKRLVKAAGLEKQLMGEPTSGTGLLRAIHDRGRVVLLVLDEIGRYIANANSKNAGSYQREIIDYIITSFSKANSVLKGKEYADVKKNPVIDIENPHFCCLGSTVEERFRESCGSTEIVDGFLNRWVVMTGDKAPVRREKVRFLAPPVSVLDRIAAMGERKYDAYGNEPELREVRFTPEAWAHFCAYRSEIDKKVREVPYPLNALYGRIPEHTEKLALTIADGNFIEMRDLQAAIAIARYSMACTMEFASLVADSEGERDYMRVRDILKACGEITFSDLTRKTQFIKGGAKRRNEILENLIDCGEIAIYKDKTKTNKVQSIKWL